MKRPPRLTTRSHRLTDRLTATILLSDERRLAVLYSAAVAASPTPARRDTDPVAIIGASGALGFGLAVRLGQAGVPVVIGSREASRAIEAAERARAAVPDGGFSGSENAQAVAAVDTIVLSVPFRSQSETLKNIKGSLRAGQLLIDATVPLAAAVSGRATRMLGVWQGSAAQAALEMVPDGVKVVSALHTVSAASLTDLDHDLAQDVLICGDLREDKRRAALLLRRIDGLRCVDCGRLEMARIAESMTALMISINAKHKTHAGVRITGLPDDSWE
jgi:8-hydroxy-5-deazaflavin:NADPH oxidoreductase